MTDEHRLLHDFILDLLYKTKDVIVIRDSGDALGFVYVSTTHSYNFRARCTYRNRFMVADDVVSPIDLLEPEIAGKVQTRKLTIRLYPKEPKHSEEDW
jgi:hypothetical protein